MKQTLHQLAKEDALTITYGDIPIEHKTKEEAAVHGAQGTGLGSVLMVSVLYISLYLFYGIQKLRGNLK